MQHELLIILMREQWNLFLIWKPINIISWKWIHDYRLNTLFQKWLQDKILLNGKFALPANKLYLSLTKNYSKSMDTLLREESTRKTLLTTLFQIQENLLIIENLNNSLDSELIQELDLMMKFHLSMILWFLNLLFGDRLEKKLLENSHKLLEIIEF